MNRKTALALAYRHLWPTSLYDGKILDQGLTAKIADAVQAAFLAGVDHCIEEIEGRARVLPDPLAEDLRREFHIL